jgi:acetyltransferase-like isoleucine patch superfamily enzyme
MIELRRTLCVAVFRLRSSGLLGVFRNAWWRLLGMKIGRGTRLGRLWVTWPHAVALGRHCIVEHDVYFKVDGPYSEGIRIDVGRNVFLGCGVEFNIKHQIIVGDMALIGSGCRFIDHEHAFESSAPIREQGCPAAAIELGPDCWLGVNVVVRTGVRIGAGAIVGAGAVVTKSIPPREIWAGVPARRIGFRESAPSAISDYRILDGGNSGREIAAQVKSSS